MSKQQLFSVARLRELEEKLEQLSRQLPGKASASPKKMVLDHFEFMEVFRISRRTSQQWRRAGKISFSRIGGRIYFSLEDIHKLMRESRISVLNSEFEMKNSEFGMKNSECRMKNSECRIENEECN